MGTALAVTPDLARRWQAGEQAAGQLQPVTWPDKTVASAASMALVRYQLRRIARGAPARAGTHPAHALVCDQLAQRRALSRYRSWLQASDAPSRAGLLPASWNAGGGGSITGRLVPAVMCGTAAAATL